MIIKLLLRIILIILFANILLVLSLACWRHFSATSLIADQILLLGFLISTLAFILSANSKYFVTFIMGRKIAEKEIISDGLRKSFAFLLSICVFFSILVVPVQTIVNVDRSRSLFIFNWVECRPDNISLQQLADLLEHKEGKETKKAFLLRYNEQSSRGLINGNGRLTYVGRLIYKIALLEVKFFNLPGWDKNKLWSDNNC